MYVLIAIPEPRTGCPTAIAPYDGPVPTVSVVPLIVPVY
jgi:hypothetical protein